MVKQLMAEIILNTPTAGEGTTSESCSECRPTNAMNAGSDLTGVVEAMNATINPVGCQWKTAKLFETIDMLSVT